DDAMGGTHAGGSVAGPIFRRVGETALRYLGVTPRGTSPVKLSELGKKDIAPGAYEALGDGKPGSGVPAPYAPAKSGEARVPDFAGLPQREVIKATIALGLVPNIEGSGRLSKQQPAAG